MLKKKGKEMNSFLDKQTTELVTKESIMLDIENKHLDLAKIQDMSNNLNKETVGDFGVAVQNKLGTASASLLESVKNNATGEIGEDLIELINVLDENNPEKIFSEDKGFFKKMFGKVKNNIELRIREHENVQKQVNMIRSRLEDGIKIIDEDNKLLQEQYTNSMNYILEVDNFIKAGELKLIDSKENLNALQTQVNNNVDDYMILEEYNNENNFYNRLDKRVFDLNASKMTVIQQLPKIRIIAEANNMLKDRIRNAIDLAIPVWTDLITNQLVLLRQEKLLEQVNNINNAVDKALADNAKLFKGNIIKAVRENEKGIIDISRIKAVHLDTVEALREALVIQDECRRERERDKVQIKELEEELHKTLILNEKDRKLIAG